MTTKVVTPFLGSRLDVPTPSILSATLRKEVELTEEDGEVGARRQDDHHQEGAGHHGD